MVSDAKKKKAAAKKKGQAVATGKGAEAMEAIEEDLKAQLENGDANGGVYEDTTTDRACTGVLGSHPQSRDIHIDSFSLLFHGHELIQDSTVQLNFGRYDSGPASKSFPGTVILGFWCKIWLWPSDANALELPSLLQLQRPISMGSGLLQAVWSHWAQWLRQVQLFESIGQPGSAYPRSHRHLHARQGNGGHRLDGPPSRYASG